MQRDELNASEFGGVDGLPHMPLRVFRDVDHQSDYRSREALTSDRAEFG